MKILVTGAAGYLGSILIPSLIEQGHLVTGLDNLSQGGHGLLGFYNHPRFVFQKGDINSDAVTYQLCQGQDVVIHLAALVGEPQCNNHPEEAQTVNYYGTQQMLEAASERDVKHFIFASTCSNYGKQPGEDLDEDTPLMPISLYAETKVKAEEMILQANASSFATTVLRFATAFGVSPRMRFDTLLNELVRDAVVNGWVLIYGKDSYRTFVHVRDIASMIALVIDKREETAGQVYNVGGGHTSKLRLAKLLQKHISGVQIEYKEQTGDPRDYKASFQKAMALGYMPEYSIEDGMKEVVQALRDRLFSDPCSGLYRNV